ncbi:MAG: photosynthetic complex assembly protein [Silicimonas sp.]|nr:photosynthetic complex assembly protein [Silicimonas sp.]
MSQLESQMKLRDKEMVPRILVQAMFALMLASLALVSFAVLTERPLTGVPAMQPIVAEVTVTLGAEREGHITVVDAAGHTVARSDKDKNGFIGVIHRVMERERMLQQATLSAPVRVVRRENGIYAVLDTVTDWSIELVGYGQDNVAAFAKLVD